MKVCRLISEVDVIGRGWYGQKCCTTYPLREYDVENIRGHGDGKITREAVESWLTCNAGDFQAIDDFRVTIGDGVLDSDFQHEESEIDYNDIMYPEE